MSLTYHLDISYMSLSCPTYLLNIEYFMVGWTFANISICPLYNRTSPLLIPFHVPYMSLTCPLHVANMSLTFLLHVHCPLHVPFMCLTCPLHVPYMSLTFPIHVLYMLLTFSYSIHKHFEG